MNRSKMTCRLLALALAAILCLWGCGGKDPASQPNDETALALAKELAANPSPYFATVEGVNTLPSALCIVVKVDKIAYFLKEDGLPNSTPETAEAVLLAQLTTVHTAGGKKEGVYDCDLLYGTPDGSLSVTVAKKLRLEKGDSLASLLQKRFTFAAGEPSLPAQLVAFGEKLRAADYQTAIDACRGAYDDALDSAPLDAAVLREPLVYLTDADYVCEPVPGNDLYTHPAEKKQYVPPMTGAYERPLVGGPVGVGLAGLGKAGDSGYTLEEVRAQLQTQPEAFCFLEVVGQDRFGNFNAADGSTSFTAYTYAMRFSVIGFDGTLLGYRTVHYPGYSQLTDMEKRFVGNMISSDKNGTAVLAWAYRPYRDAFFKALG